MIQCSAGTACTERITCTGRSPPADIGKIAYRPDAQAEEVLCFRHYNAEEVVMGHPMEEWLRFSVCFWHTFRGTGETPLPLSLSS